MHCHRCREGFCANCLSKKLPLASKYSGQPVCMACANKEMSALQQQRPASDFALSFDPYALSSLPVISLQKELEQLQVF